MNINKITTILQLCILAMLFLLYQTIIKQTFTRQTKPYVVCTTTIIGDTIHQIAGNTIHLEILMGPGVDPHTYKPVENDLIKIVQADLIVYHGLHLEARMADLFKHLSSTKNTFPITQDIPCHLLISSNDDNSMFDPHVWFDPRLWIYAIQTMTHKLSQLIPEHAQLYQQNAQRFIHDLNALYASTKTELLEIPNQNRYLITSHDAFSYFAQAYDFNVVSLCGINTASEAGLCDVQNVIQTILQHKIPTIFVESSMPPRSMQAIQQGVIAHHHQVTIGKELYSDALGAPCSPANTYLDMLKYNIQAIKDGLSSQK